MYLAGAWILIQRIELLINGYEHYMKAIRTEIRAGSEDLRDISM